MLGAEGPSFDMERDGLRSGLGFVVMSAWPVALKALRKSDWVIASLSLLFSVVFSSYSCAWVWVLGVDRFCIRQCSQSMCLPLLLC